MSLWTDVMVIHGERGGVLGAPVSKEEFLCLALQGLLAVLHGGAGLVHHYAHASSVGEVVFRPVRRP